MPAIDTWISRESTPNLSPRVSNSEAAGHCMRPDVLSKGAVIMRRKILITLFALVLPVVVTAQTRVDFSSPKSHLDRDAPDFRVQVWGDIVTDFSARVCAYVELRSELEKGLPALTVTNDPAEIRRAVRTLAKRIRMARADAKQGDIFTPIITVQFRKVLLLEMNGNALAAIMDDNPGELSHQINGNYPEGKPLSTMPPNILARLPRLPDDIQYRFLGRHLILLDARANLILDRILYAIQCADCDNLTSHR